MARVQPIAHEWSGAARLTNMRVLLSCLQATRRHPISAYQFWDLYFKRGLEEAGWEWVEVPDVDWAEPLAFDERDHEAIARWRERTWEQVVDFARREHVVRPLDMFLGYLYPRHVDVGAIGELQRLGVPCVNFFCDNVREFRQVPDEYRCFDLHWVPECEAVSMYRRAGLPCVHAAMPVWVPPERRRWDHEERYGPTFIGGRDVQREQLFAAALAAGADIRLRGPGWNSNETPKVETLHTKGSSVRLIDRVKNQGRDLKRFGPLGLLWKMTYRFQEPITEDAFLGHVDPAAFGEAYAEVTQQARITIGVNRYPSYYHPFGSPGRYSRLRDIEAPMLGACYLTEWAEGIDGMYEIGKEVETFRSAAELVEKISALNADPARRRSMRRLGQERALTDHSVPRSLQRIAAAIGATV